MSDPYVYPGTSVLRNRLDIQDATQLRTAERLLTAQRLERPLPDVPISYDGYKALHRHIFEPLYEWAGEPRTVNIAKGDTLFAAWDRVDPSMVRQFTLIAGEQQLQGLPAERFAERAGDHLCELNAIHPFREGNGRTQRAFLKVLATQAGHAVDLRRIEPGAWNTASISGFAADYKLMSEVIGAALVPAGEGREVGGTSSPQISDAFRERSRKAARELGPSKINPNKGGPGHDIE